MIRRIGQFCIATVFLAGALSSPTTALATGEGGCVGSTNSFAVLSATVSGAWERGTRATIEGQALPLCIFTGSYYASGSFHWASLTYKDPNWAYAGQGVNIIQVGYGRCSNADNNLGLGILCNGSYYRYWAWGSYCGSGVPQGTYPGAGPVPIRIGPALSSPPPSSDFYVLRRLVNGVPYYQGFVGGQLLSGLDALGQNVTASVPASSICWDSSDTGSYRTFDWFGETWNTGDSMGGWTGSTRNHLDYTSMRYSVNTGWLSPGLAYPGPCYHSAPMYSCTVAGTDHIYIDTSSSR